MKKKWTLRTFLVVVMLLGVITSLTWERFLLNPVKLDQVVLGEITSADDYSKTPLTLDELKWAVARQKTNAGSSDQVLLIENATIEEYESSVDSPRNLPLIGYAELRRTIYQCRVDAKHSNGTPVKRILYVEKNHFHLLD